MISEAYLNFQLTNPISVLLDLQYIFEWSACHPAKKKHNNNEVVLFIYAQKKETLLFLYNRPS